ncbi:MAG: ATP-dependent helicase [Phycisphaerales bacterium]
MAEGSAAPEKLNAAQQKAVDHADGPLIVLAGPGTGKTRVIVHRVERIIRDGADPRSVAAITFTNKSAAELRGRLAASIGADAADRMYAGTIHGFGDRLIRRYGDMIDLPARQVLLDSARRKRLLRELVGEHNLYADLVAVGRGAIVADAATTIERCQNWCVFPARAQEFAADWVASVRGDVPGLDAGALAAERVRAARFAEHARLYGLFDAACRERGWYSYGDMVLLAVRVLGESALAATLARDEVRHVVVDEFQDVDRGQIELLRLLCPPERKPDLCVVGDDDQSIYGFRGADDRAFARFADIWTEHRTIPLEWNYRSEAPIIAAANAVMARADVRFAPDKVVAPPPERQGSRPPPGSVVEVVEYRELDEEGDAVAAMILADRRRNPGRPWSSYAVIGRIYKDLDRVAGALAVEGVPARLARGASVLDDRGVQDLHQWIDVLSEPDSAYATLWLLSRPPFDVPVEEAARWARLHRAESSRHEAGEDGREAPGSFIAWLGRRAAADARVARFLGVHAELAEAAAKLPAYEAALRVVRAGQLAHAELLPARERSLRIGRLADALGFIRERSALLDAPGDLRAFRSYFADLDEKEQGVSTDDTDRFAEADPDAETPDAVTLLTAYKAKGLEFDTVFVLRVFPQFGFPWTRGDDDVELPDGLTDRAGDERPLKARRLAEERRVFYVACTRAERRLVMLAKESKSRSSSTHFVHELVRDGPAPAGLVKRTADDVYAAAREAGVELSGQARLGGEGPTLSDRRAMIEHQQTRARRAAAEALDSIDRPGVSAADLDAAGGRLRSAAARLAMTAQLGGGAPPPAWIAAEGLGEESRDFAARLAAEGEQHSSRPDAVLRPLAAPLKLSYTAIMDYTKCPRCFYLKHEFNLKEGADRGVQLGQVAHVVLHRFYQSWLRAQEEGRATPGKADLLGLGRKEFFRALAPGEAAPPGMLDKLLGQLALTHDRLHDARAEIEDLELAIKFSYEHAGVSHGFEAKLDRLDRLPGEGGHLIIDYKTGQATKEKREPPKDDLQLGVYALALRHHQGIALSDRTTPARGAAEYWLLATGERGRIDLAAIKYDKIRATIGGAIDGMLAGRFDRGEKCGGLCDILGPG